MLIIWLASYPRSGNTALRILLKNNFGLSTHSIYDDRRDIGGNSAVRDLVGHVDHGLKPDEFINLASHSSETFYVKTHELPSDSSKAIYVVRDGRSSVVSFKHWLDRYVQNVERQPPCPAPTTTLAGGAERKTGLPVWRAAPPA